MTGEDYVDDAPVTRRRFWLLVPLALVLGAAVVLRAGGGDSAPRPAGDDPIPSPSARVTEYAVLVGGTTRTDTEEDSAYQTVLRSVWDEDVTVLRVVPVDEAGKAVTPTVALVSYDSDAIQRVFAQRSPMAPVVLTARGSAYLMVRFDTQCADRPAVVAFRATLLVDGQERETVLQPVAWRELASLTRRVCPR